MNSASKFSVQLWSLPDVKSTFMQELGDHHLNPGLISLRMEETVLSESRRSLFHSNNDQRNSQHSCSDK